jgi:hypothetical protein
MRLLSRDEDLMEKEYFYFIKHRICAMPVMSGSEFAWKGQREDPRDQSSLRVEL